MADSSPFQIFVNIFASPREALAAIRERPRFALPLILVPLVAAATAGLYLSEVDIGWITEQQLRSVSFIDMTDDQIDQAVAAAVDRGPTLLITQGVISTFLFVIILLLVQALYLKIVSLFTKDSIRYAQWFGLFCWTSLPALLSSIATAVFVLTNDISFVPQTQINPISFGNLLALDLSDSSTVVRAVANISPVNLWSVVLVILGYATFTGRGAVFSTTVVLAPIAFIAAILIAIL